MKKTIIGLTALASMTSAFAQSTTSTTSVNSTWEKIKANTSMGYYGEVYNSDVSNTDGRSVALYNSIGVNYALNSEIKLFVNPRFMTNMTTEDGRGAAQDRFATVDPRLGIKQSYSEGDVATFNMLRIIPSVTDVDKVATIQLNASKTLTVSSVHSFSGAIWLMKNVYTGNADLDAQSLHSITPDLTYTFKATDKVSLFTELQLQFAHMPSKSATSLALNAGSNSEVTLGATYQATPAIELGTAVYADTVKAEANEYRRDQGLRVYIDATVF